MMCSKILEHIAWSSSDDDFTGANSDIRWKCRECNAWLAALLDTTKLLWLSTGTRLEDCEKLRLVLLELLFIFHLIGFAWRRDLDLQPSHSESWREGADSSAAGARSRPKSHACFSRDRVPGNESLQEVSAVHLLSP